MVLTVIATLIRSAILGNSHIYWSTDIESHSKRDMSRTYTYQNLIELS